MITRERSIYLNHATDPRSTIFVDDKLENVSIAWSLGIQGIVFGDVDQVAKLLQRDVSDPITRAWNYLDMKAGYHQSYTNTGIVFPENFAQLLILEATGKQWDGFQIIFRPCITDDCLGTLSTVLNTLASSISFRVNGSFSFAFNYSNALCGSRRDIDHPGFSLRFRHNLDRFDCHRLCRPGN